MAGPFLPQEASLELLLPDASSRFIAVTHSPFRIGRGGEAGNDLQLEDRRVSRRCALLTADAGGWQLSDLGNSLGVFVNGKRAVRQSLKDSDTIDFGLEDGCRIVFHMQPSTSTVEAMLTRLGTMPSMRGTPTTDGLDKLNLLLEATLLLHSSQPLEAVLAAMLDHAISITHADRGLLLEPPEDQVVKARLARGATAEMLIPEDISPSQTAIRLALDSKAAVITEDLNLADLNLQSAQSIVIQGLRAVVVIPLYAHAHSSMGDTGAPAQGQLLGVIYLDSRRPAAFSNLERQILDALGAQAASILDNARLVERERERQRLDQELSIAREIQQALMPKGLHDFSHLAVTGTHLPCYEVGGDYFDVFPISEDRTAFLVADVSGKGLGAALLTTMLQGALSGMTLGSDPVKVFSHVNRFLCEHAVVGRYATMFYATIDREGVLEFVPAGHPAPLLMRGEEVTELYDGGSFPVGLIDVAQFESTRVQLQPGDTLILFSDGVTEAEGAERELFGYERLKKSLDGRNNDSVESIQEAVLREVHAFASVAGQSDDVTLLVVRYLKPGSVSA